MDFDDIVLDDYNFNVEAPTTQPQTTDIPTDSTPESAKQKAKVKKLDENLLLSNEGLPRLMSEASFLRFDSTDREEENLKKLMRYYQLWANHLYPKYRFTDFARKVTKPASSKLVKERVSVWQDEYRQKKRVRDEVEADGQSEEEDEEDEETYHQRILDSVFPVRSNEVKKDRSPSPMAEKPLEDPVEEPAEEEPVPNRKDALSILAERRKKRNLPAVEKEVVPEKRFVELSDSEDEEPVLKHKRRLIRRTVEDEDDTLESPDEGVENPDEADMDLSSIPMFEDIQMENLGDIHLDEEQ